MVRVALAWMLAAVLLKGASPPALPYYDWRACPFEGCTYGRWTTRKAVTVYDTWATKRRSIARLAVGDQVDGLTGVVITFKPGVILMDRDWPSEGLKRGDTIFTYANRGEGFSAVFFNGKYDPEFDISFAKLPDGQGCGGTHCAARYVDLGKKAWWAQVKLKSGRTGWIDMDGADFDGLDSLAGGLTSPNLTVYFSYVHHPLTRP
jgi:hypothetical protein